MTEITEEIIEVQGDAKIDKIIKKWCVYLHTNLINGKVYVGITSKYPPEKRWANGNGYKEHPYFWNAIQKYGWNNFKHEILLSNLTKQEACAKEQEIIKLYRANKSEYGYNMTDGGEGTCGYVMSDSTKQKISEFAKTRTGEKNSNYNNHKLSDANNPNYGRRGELHPGYSRKHTEIELEKIRLGNLGERNPMYGKHGIENPHTILVYCKELEQLFCGAMDAENKIKVAHQSISKCCKGKRNYAGKSEITNMPLHWTYVYDQYENDGSVIHGAITLGYITEETVNNYLNSLIEKGND